MTAVERAPDMRRPAGTGTSARATVALGVVGEVLITLGVLLGLFLVWQLWWTDVLGERAQAAVVTELGFTSPAAHVAQAPELRRDPAPVLDQPAYLTTFATLQVPRWDDVARPISQGTAKHEVLDALGIGHYEGTAMPGEIGNFAVAGHRTTYGKPFHRIAELAVGDALVVRTAEAWYVYLVTGSEVVGPQQVEVIAPVPGDLAAVPTQAVMTLTTCHPMYSARERYVVHAVLDHWLPAVDGTPAELEAGA